MSRARKSKRGRRGETLVEVLVAALIVGVCIASLVSLWSFSFMTTRDSDDQDIAYTLARNAIETVKQTGFAFTPEAPASAPVVHYYDSNQANLDSKPTTARFKVTT